MRVFFPSWWGSLSLSSDCYLPVVIDIVKQERGPYVQLSTCSHNDDEDACLLVYNFTLFLLQQQRRCLG